MNLFSSKSKKSDFDFDNETEAVTVEKNDETAAETQSFNSKIHNKRKKRKKAKKAIVIAVLAVMILIIIAVTGVLGNILTALNLDGFASRIGLGGLLKTQGSSATDKFTTYTVSTRSITHVLTSTGTIEPNDQYTINALVSGEIIGDYFEEGDTVVEDQLLYKIDSDNLNSGVTRAKNSLKNANKSLEDALENLEKLNIESDTSGTIKKIHVEVGDSIKAGTLIADVVDDNTMCADIPFMDIDCKKISIGDKAIITLSTYEEISGIVTEISPVTHINVLGVAVRDVTISVNNKGSITPSMKAYAQIGDAYCTDSANFYNNDEGQIFAEVSGDVAKLYFKEGQKINDGQVIARLESEDLLDTVDKLRDTVKEAEESLEDANDAYDNYNIEAPITGKVISKSYKSGDTLSGNMGGSNSLATIYDMSALKFTMSIDELDIDKLEKGQEVIVTCDSRVGVEYKGTVTNISIQGTTSSGTTAYPVEVTIYNTEDPDKRIVNEDGTISKSYLTGMTSTEKTHKLSSVTNENGKTIYEYEDGITIIKTTDGSYYDGSKLLKEYLDGTYTQGSNFYSFSNDFSTLTLEIQNDKKMLRPGMNINAKIVVEKRENVIAVPLAAVGRGNVVKVLKTNNSNSTETVKFKPEADGERNNPETTEMEKPAFGKEPEGFVPNGGTGYGKAAYGTADIDAEYEEVRVTVGISDDDYVQITSGLNVGDTVIIDTASRSSSFPMQYGMMGTGMDNGMSGGMMGGHPSGMGTGMPGGMRGI